jgi:peptide chain release factor subunit 1
MATAVTTDTLRSLAAFRARNGCAITLTVDLDPSTTPTIPDVKTKLSSAIARAEKLAETIDSSRDCRLALRADVERLRDWLGHELDRDGARSIAVFASSADDLFRVLPLAESVPDSAHIGASLHIAPLVSALEREGDLVLVVSRERGTVYRFEGGRLREVADESEEQPGQHDQGGWSQARYQRSVDKEATDHLKNAADELLRLHKRRPFEALFVGAPEAIYKDFCARLHPYLSERVVGRIEIDVEHTGVDEVQHAAAPTIAEYERKLEKDALDRLQQATATGGRGASGLEDTLAALNEQRVEVLLLQDNFDSAGVCCPQCGWLGPSGVDTCPADGTRTVEREDITDLAVRRAIMQSAQVVRVRDDARLEPMGSIAAVLRF